MHLQLKYVSQTARFDGVGCSDAHRVVQCGTIVTSALMILASRRLRNRVAAATV
jgi:hypothetical protein